MLRRISWLQKKRYSGRATRGPPQPAHSSNDSLVQVPSFSSAIDVERDESPSTFPVPHVAPTSSTDLPLSTPSEMPKPELHVRISDDIELLEASATVPACPRGSRIEDVLDREGERDERRTQMYSSVDVGETVEALKSGIDTTWENIRWLMEALDDVAMIHPFVAAPILAFKAVYCMERTRRENNKRVVSLHFAMKEMMSVLVELRGIKNPYHVFPNGTTFKSRMQMLAERAALDIKDCANVCDTYSKKKLLVKVLTGSAWDVRLTDFLDRFTKLQSEFKLAFALYTVRSASEMHTKVHDISEKVDVVTKLLHGVYRELQPEDEVTLAAKIEERGGVDAVKKDDTALRELLRCEDSIEAANLKSTTKFDETAPASHTSDNFYIKLRPEISERTAYKSDLSLLKNDLHEGVSAAVESNMEAFERKFDLHTRQLQQDLYEAIHEGNKQVMRHLNSGPHERVRHAELSAIWRDMGWRLNVEANRFVTTLQDHFREQAGEYCFGPLASPCVSRADEWAFDYVGMQYLQQMKEAFDEDGSGYVTVREVNRLVEMLPNELNWSLPHWIAYWTIGWQIAATRYRDLIRGLFARMFAIRARVLPENRSWVDTYLEKAWLPAIKTCESLRPVKQVPNHARTKFRPYVQLEERRIAQNLESVDYNLDALDTVKMVLDTDTTLENHIFALMYLLLKHHLTLLRAATVVVLVNEEDLIVAAASLQQVFDAMHSRYLELITLFKQQRVDVTQQMKSFACELFEYHHNPMPLWKAIHAQIAIDEAKHSTLAAEVFEDDDEDLEDSLASSRHFLMPSASPYDLPPQGPKPLDTYATLTMRQIVGEWNGFVYSDHQYPLFLMTSFYAHVSAHNPSLEFEAHGTHYGATYTLEGQCWREPSGSTRVAFVITYSQEFRTKYYQGRVTEDGSIEGYQGWQEGARQYPFILKRTPADIMCHRPPPSTFRVNKPRALWSFACAATLNDVQRKMWSWSYFKQRRKTRLRQIHFDIRNYTPYGRPLNKPEREEWAAIRQAMTAADARFFRNIRDRLLRIMPGHPGKICDGCGYRIGGARVICLDCQAADGNLHNTIDFCDDPHCYSKVVSTEKRSFLTSSHLPSHDIVKVRTAQHFRDMYAMTQSAHAALNASRCLLEDGVTEDNERVFPNWPDNRHPAPKIEIPGECICSCTTALPDKYEHPRKNETCMTPDDRSEIQLPKEFRESTDQLVARTRTWSWISTQGEVSEATCNVCDSPVAQPCWFCVDCFVRDRVIFICDDCEAKTLLRCMNCSCAYRQPSWYYGSNRGDSFLCNKCQAQHVAPLCLPKADQHTYVHTLVRCKSKNKEGQLDDTSPGALSRDVAVLTAKLMELQAKMEVLAAGRLC